MARIPKALKVDVQVWASYEEWMPYDVSMLVLGIDPERLDEGREYRLSKEQQSEREKVSRIINELRKRRGYQMGIPPIEVVRRLERAKISLPEGLAEQVIANAPPEPEKRAASKKIDTRQYNRVLKLFVYFACSKFGEQLIREDNSIARSIVDFISEYGGTVDDQTVLARLKEGLRLLNDRERDELALALKIRKSAIEAFASR